MFCLLVIRILILNIITTIIVIHRTQFAHLRSSLTSFYLRIFKPLLRLVKLDHFFVDRWPLFTLFGHWMDVSNKWNFRDITGFNILLVYFPFQTRGRLPSVS